MAAFAPPCAVFTALTIARAVTETVVSAMPAEEKEEAEEAEKEEKEEWS